MQVWFQNARAKFRRNAVKSSDRQRSPSVPPAPHLSSHPHHHRDAVVVAAAGVHSSEVHQSSADDVNSASPISLLDLHTRTITSNMSGSSNSSISAAGYEPLTSPSTHCTVPALTDILCCPSFTIWYSCLNESDDRNLTPFDPIRLELKLTCVVLFLNSMDSSYLCNQCIHYSENLRQAEKNVLTKYKIGLVDTAWTISKSEQID